MDRGLIPATVAPPTIDMTISSTLVLPPTLDTISGTVGIRVGSTTPLAELNQDMIPAVRPMRGAAVTWFIMEASRLESSSIPPISFVTLISTFTPQIRISTLHGTSRTAAFSFTAPIRIRISARANDTSPTSY